MAILYPVYQSKRVSLEEIQAMSGFTRLHPTLRDRVTKLMVGSGGKVGFGEGFRGEDQQKQMFLSRYKQDPNGKVRWNGARWKHVSGATAAPPGRSMHELGLAADLVGDMAWITANCGQFALRNFAFVNDEPWHVQPFELPKSRADYEKMGRRGRPRRPRRSRRPRRPRPPPTRATTTTTPSRPPSPPACAGRWPGSSRTS
jgi:hypothetical protein